MSLNKRIMLLTVIVLLTLTGCNNKEVFEETEVLESIEVIECAEVDKKILKYPICTSYEEFVTELKLDKEVVITDSFKVIGFEDIMMIEFMYPYRSYPSNYIKVGSIEDCTTYQKSVYISDNLSRDELIEGIIYEYMLTDMNWLISTMSNENKNTPIDFKEWEWNKEHEEQYQNFVESLIRLYNVEYVEDLSVTIKKQDYSDITMDAYCLNKSLSVYGEECCEKQMYFWICSTDKCSIIFKPETDCESINIPIVLNKSKMCSEFLDSEYIKSLIIEVLYANRNKLNEQALVDNAYWFKDTLSNKIFYIEER